MWGQLGLLDHKGHKGAESSMDDFNFISRRRGSHWRRKGGRCLEFCQGSVKTVGFEEMEVPRLLIACICKHAADPICVV